MPRTRVAFTLALLILLAACLTTPAGASSTSGDVTRATSAIGTKRTIVLRSQAIPMSAPEIANPMRGQYEWLGATALPAGFPTKDVYYRDQVAWKRVEPSPGGYDFTYFDEGLARAHELGGRFGFRVMAWCPGCWLDATPDWLPRQPGTDIPDWNDEAFLAAWDRLMAELGERYAGDPALGWVDVGGYGAWGEWHNANQGAEITVDNAVRMMRSVLDHFPDQHVIINAMVPKYVDAATALSPRMGLRVDCLGEFNMFSLLPTSPVLQERWKTAPVLSEWCLTAGTSTTLGAEQVRQFHISQVARPNDDIAARMAADPAVAAGFVDAAKSSGYRYVLSALRVPRKLPATGSFTVRSLWRNDGSAPTYDDWRVTLQVRKRGAVVASTDLRVDLRKVLPGTTKLKRAVDLGKLKRGRYSLWVTVTDPVGYLAPMNLAISGRRPDGAYRIGLVRVARRPTQ
jgi:uncharacterized protein DUF4832/glycosyl hydrolase family 42 (putative beta-galactosidase)